MLKNYFARLLRAVRSSEHRIDVVTDSLEHVQPTGVAYHLTLLDKGGDDLGWFEGTLWAQEQSYRALQAGGAALHWPHHRLHYLFHWPTFLGAASSSSGSTMAHLSRELLTYFLPLVEEFCQPLHHDLKLFAARKAQAGKSSPNFMGIVTTEEAARYDHYLSVFLSNPAVMKAIVRTMRVSLAPLIPAGAQQRLGLCEAKHLRSKPCEVCASWRWMRHGLLVADTRCREQLLFRGVSFKPHFPPLGYANAKPSELRYLLHCDRPEDGVKHFYLGCGGGDQILVDFSKVRALAVAQERESFTLRYENPVKPKDVWTGGYLARLAFNEETKNRLLGTRVKPLGQLVQEAGWEWREQLEHPYELFSVAAIFRQMGLYKRVRRAVEKQVRRSSGIKDIRRNSVPYVTLNYVSTRLIPYTIQVVQRNTTIHDPYIWRQVCLFTTPFEVGSDLRADIVTNKWGVHSQGVCYWNLRGLEVLAHFRPHNDKGVAWGDLLYPEAQAFLDWASQQSVLMTPERFKKYKYDQRYTDRLRRVKIGYRKFLGAFTQDEDKIVLDFFLNREKRQMIEEDWKRLAPRLPLRSPRSIARRLEDLAFDYALEHGWAAYVQSGLCLRISTKRRREWMRKGVRA